MGTSFHISHLTFSLSCRHQRRHRAQHPSTLPCRSPLYECRIGRSCRCCLSKICGSSPNSEHPDITGHGRPRAMQAGNQTAGRSRAWPGPGHHRPPPAALAPGTGRGPLPSPSIMCDQWAHEFELKRPAVVPTSPLAWPPRASPRSGSWPDRRSATSFSAPTCTPQRAGGRTGTVASDRPQTLRR
jgi:hypothetical protein